MLSKLLLLRLNVEIFVHLLRVVILDLVLKMIQEKHLWLVQSFNYSLHLCRTALQVGCRICTELVCLNVRHMRTTSHVIGYPSWLGKLVTTWWMISILCCHTCLVLSGRLGSTWWWRVLLLTSPQVKGACRDCVCRNTHHSSLIIIAVVGHCDLVWIVGVFDHWGEVARFGLLFAWSICHLLLLNWELMGDRIFLITVIKVAFGHLL